jgi:hypothetical protein
MTETYSLVLWEEAFANLTDDQWTGPRFHLGETNLEIGYLHQYIPRKGVSTHEHILTTYLYF